MTEPLKLFWGLWTIPMWGYYDAYTEAQIELMAVDVPIVVYDHDNGKRKNRGKGGFKKSNAASVEDATKQWEEKYKRKDSKVEIDLNGFS